MTGPGSRATARATLLADADVLIDFCESGDLEVLALVVRHVGPLCVVATILDEVRQLEPDDCVRLGIQIVEATTEQQIRAARIEARASFNDRVCLVVCRDEGWTCVTNDRALQGLCRSQGVPVRFGLGLLVDLAATQAISRSRAETVARRIQTSNPLHINERVLAGFRVALDRVSGN